MAQRVISGVELLDRMVERLPQGERSAFEAGVRHGYVILEGNEEALPKVWTLWCMRKQCADIRVQRSDGFATITMHLGPSHCTLSGDGMIAIKRAFERYGDKALFYRTQNWCKHPHVPAQACDRLARKLLEIASLDSVADVQWCQAGD